MEKRKASSGGGGSANDMDEREPKRRKMPMDDLHEETPETTTKIGLDLLETLKTTADKAGRRIATAFLTLPSRKQAPDYYKVIKMPIALDTVEAKLRRKEFPHLVALEAYFKRMVSNAKEYNERGSQIYEDAERLRKALSNFMVRHNPAYKTHGYQAMPTPFPSDMAEANGAIDEDDQDAEGEPDPEAEAPVAKRKPARPTKVQLVQRSSATPALSDVQYAGVGFEGLTFQQAQEKIVEDMIRKKEFKDDEFAHFEPFIVLPSRTDYKDYYKVIKNPVSLKSFQKRVKGGQGKQAATGISEFKSWSSFEEEASVIWKNAYEYNEDGSSIHLLGQELEKTFKKYIQEAKASVPEPAGPKIKLKLNDTASKPKEAPNPKIMLKFGSGSKSSPAPSPAPQLGPQINGSAAVAPASSSGRRNPFGASQGTSTPGPQLEQLDRARSASSSVASPSMSTSTLVKNEEAPRHSPAMLPNVHRGSVHPVSTPGTTTNGMLPPSTPGVSASYNTSGYAQSFGQSSQQLGMSIGSEVIWRASGKGAADALIQNISLATHPGLHLAKHFRMEVPPSPTMAQQSLTITLPSTHYFLQIKPRLSDSLRERQHRLFATCNGNRVNAQPIIPNHPLDSVNALFECRLVSGVNRIDIEVAAALPKGSARLANGQDMELEKTALFVNLLQ